MRCIGRCCLRALFAVWYYAFFLTLTLLAGFLCLFLSLFSRKAARVVTGVVWASVVFGPAFIGLETRGRDNIPKKGGFVIFVNHRSLLDIPAVAMSTGLPVTWLAKASLGRIPLFGWCLKRGHMLIEREGGTEAAKKMVAEAEERLNAGEIISIFPEGTRNMGDSPLLPFKKGAFILAKHTGAQLLPIATYNTGNLWPKGALLPHSGKITVSIGKPMAFGPKDTLNVITQKCQDTLLGLYSAMESDHKALLGERDAEDTQAKGPGPGTKDGGKGVKEGGVGDAGADNDAGKSQA
ncbi:MAG: 1-acyl-sn-glycerol-3-phosphate acyltransferase [Deltaproteobacteria bacterium]|jgi:1-acyl-sn-glycerol-3-phosphate acyltransferase|nr:1-acyl-sn-glycerol-3-phosphate acyltransferase [Deltaproteobacteria bacterium]